MFLFVLFFITGMVGGFGIGVLLSHYLYIREIKKLINNFSILGSNSFDEILNIKSKKLY